MKRHIILLFVILWAVAQVLAEETKKIIVRGDDSFPPYEFINDKGEPDGFNVDLTRAIMEELNLPYELQLGNWAEMLHLLENKEVDLITGIAASKEREGRYLMSKPHSFINYRFVCRESDSLNPANLTLKGKRVIVQNNAAPHEKLKTMNHDHIIVVDDMVKGLRLLAEGRGDLAICPDNMSNYIIFKNGLTTLELLDSYWPTLDYCYASNNYRLLNQIDAAILELKRNGTYNRIKTKWMGEDKVTEIPIWIYILLCSLSITAFLMYFFVQLYRKRAHKSRRLLREEYEKLTALNAENQLLIKRYLTVFNSTLVGFSFYNKNGVLVNINDSMLKLYSCHDKDQLLETSISIYDNPFLRNHGIIDENNRIYEFHGMVKHDMREGQCPEYFTRFAPLKDILYLKMDVIPIRSNKDELEGILITAINQTLEVNHERIIQEEEAKLDLVLAASDIAAWTYNPDTQIFNTIRGNALAGVGITLEEDRKMMHPDDWDCQVELFEALLSGEKKVAEMTPRFKHEDGTYHYYENRMTTRTENEKVIAIMGTQKDVTIEKLNTDLLNQTVKKLFFAIRTAGMAMWEYNCETEMFTTFNDPMTHFVDGAPISMSDYDWYFQEGSNWEGQREAKRIMSIGADESYSFTVKMKTQYDADWQYCTLRSVPLEKNDAGKVVRYLGLRENITEQVRYQEMLLEDKDRALQADKLKSAFLANMSHEIRTPLNAIVGFSELLMVTENAEERADYMSIISRSNEQLLHLVGDILDLSKIESGLIELNPKEFDLADTFRELVTMMKQRCTAPDVSFVSHNPYKTCKVTLDKERLMQVGMNFATNSIKHTSSGRILMGYDYVDNGIKIFVTDTGRGIPQNKQSRLFQRFSKLDDVTQGTGLGLAICKAIIDAQDGKIGVESEEGAGSTFWAWFPCEAEVVV